MGEVDQGRGYRDAERRSLDAGRGCLLDAPVLVRVIYSVRRGHPATPPAACDEFAGRHRRARAKLMTARLPRSYPSRELAGTLTTLSCWSFSALTRCGRSLAVYAVIAR